MTSFARHLLVPGSLFLLFVAIGLVFPKLLVLLLAVNLVALLALHGLQAVAAFRSPLRPERRRKRCASRDRNRDGRLFSATTQEPFVSVHVPISDEPPQVVRATLDSLAALEYDAWEAIVLDNNTRDPRVWKPVEAHCRRLGRRFRFYHFDELEGAKAGALNVCLRLSSAATQLILTVDSDYRIEPTILARALPYFDSKKVSHVQFPQAYRGPDGRFGKRIGLGGDYWQYFSIIMELADATRSALLTGTLSVIRKDALLEVGGWSSRTITEDAELGLRLTLAGYEGRYAPEIGGRGLMPNDLGELRKQRRRWVFGNAQTLFGTNWSGLTRLGFRRTLSVLVQLSAWFNFLLAPLAALVAVAALPPGGERSVAGAIAGASFVVYTVTRFLAFAGAARRSGHGFGAAAASFRAHVGLLWEGATSWFEAALGRKLPFQRTRKLGALPARAASIPQLVASAAALGSGAILFERASYLAGAGGLLAAVLFASVLFLDRELRQEAARAASCSRRPDVLRRNSKERTRPQGPRARSFREGNMTPLRINITIPTYNRAFCLGKAIEAALDQSYPYFTVTVVDDGSRDDTARVVRRFAGDPRLAFIRLGRNVGTACAKNVSILLSRFDAITFHDSDDLPKPHKLLLQARALSLEGHRADEILNWAVVGHAPGSDLRVDVVVGAYDLIKADGTTHRISRRISLVDDFFPNLQFPAKTEGDWCLVNAGLFRRSVFERFGGYLDSIEEDRELRNRTIAGGCIYYFVEQPLLTKIEMDDSLTMTLATGYSAERRRRDRDEVWRRNELYRRGLAGPSVARENKVAIDLSDLEVEEVIRPELLAFNASIPATPATRERLRALFAGAERSRRVDTLAVSGEGKAYGCP